MNTETNKGDWALCPNFSKINSNYPDLNLPNTNEIVWRYLSYERFIQLLESSSIYLARIDMFSDFREGSQTNTAIEISAQTMRHFKLDMSNLGPDALKEQVIDQEEAKQMASLAAGIGHMSTQNSFYANCWNLSPNESNLMWRAYGTPAVKDKSKFKVAIKTTAFDLLSSLKLENEQYLYGKVSYIDYTTGTGAGGSLIDSVFQKRIEYETENELRFAIFNSDQLPAGAPIEIPDAANGKLIETNLERLIKSVYIEGIPHSELNSSVSNTTLSETERKNLVRDQLSKHGINNIPIEISTVL